MSELFASLSNCLGATKPQTAKRNATVWFPNEKTGLQFDVAYHVDQELYRNGIGIESINFGESADFSEYFNEATIEQFEDLIAQQLAGTTFNHHGTLIKFEAA